MDATEPTGTGTIEPKVKSRTRPKAKAPSAPKGKRSLNLSLPVEVYERLAVHSIRLDTTISDLVSRLATDHLREYHISRTGRASDGASE